MSFGAGPPAPEGDRLDPPVRTERVFQGAVLNLRVSGYRRPDGTEVTREVMDHVGAVVMVPLADDHILLVRQPREAIERFTLELPAGKLDVPGEPPLRCARRELVEEVGRQAATWRHLGGFFMSPAILTEYIHLFIASDLTEVPATAPPEEGLEVVRWPLADLDALIARIDDAKSLIGLLRLERELRGGP